jgi:polyisoprenyl-phosphate glycosyltransferase
MSSAVTISLVIPVFNEGPGLRPLIERLCACLALLEETRAEVIFVDDASTDNSTEILRSVCLDNPNMFRFIRLSRNRGSHVAILAGLAQAKGECCVFMASDLQDPPELIAKMLGQWRDGFHVVWAVRARREGVSRRETFFSNLFYWILNTLGDVQFPPSGADFALLDKTVVDALLQTISAHPSLGIDIASLGFRQTQIEYVKEARKFGTTSWTLGRKLKAFADAFVSSTYVPLRLMSYLGMLFSVVGLLYACLIIFMRVVLQTQVTGWASLMVVTLVVGGIQMVMLGVLGEYLWRTLEAARNAPLYFIEDSENVPRLRSTGCDGR